MTACLWIVIFSKAVWSFASGLPPEGTFVLKAGRRLIPQDVAGVRAGTAMPSAPARCLLRGTGQQGGHEAGASQWRLGVARVGRQPGRGCGGVSKGDCGIWAPSWWRRSADAPVPAGLSSMLRPGKGPVFTGSAPGRPSCGLWPGHGWRIQEEGPCWEGPFSYVHKGWLVFLPLRVCHPPLSPPPSRRDLRSHAG